MKKYGIGLIILLFLLIYYPPIIKINTLHIVGLISWSIILIKNTLILRYIKLKKILYIYTFFVISIFFVFFLAKFNQNSIDVLARLLFWAVDIVPASIVCVYYFLKNKYEFEDVLDVLLIVGTIQGVLALLTFIFPDFQKVFIDRLISFGYKDSMYNLSSFRMYGISSGLNFSTPIYQSFLTILAVYLAIRKNTKYILYVPGLLFSGLINARSSIVILVIGLIAILVNNLVLNIKVFIKTLIFMISSLGLSLILLTIIRNSIPQTYAWINSGAIEIRLFLNGHQTGYFDYITTADRYILPNGINLWFGTGGTSLSSYGLQSDVGWVNDIWSYGIIYTSILYTFFINLILKMYKSNISNIKLNNFLAIFLFGILVLSNFKGIIFNVNEIITTMFILYLFVVGGEMNAKSFNHSSDTSI